MSQKKGVSIVLPTYNRAHMIKAAIDSVLAQTYTNFELIIIDDGSTDETEQMIAGYQDERIHYYKLEQNGGQAKARNYGIAKARYDLIAFEDSDDIWHPMKLEKQMKALSEVKDKVGMVYHKLKYEIEDYGTLILPKGENEKRSGDIFAQLLWDNMIGMPTLLVRKCCIEDVGGFDESLECLEDYDLVLRIAKKYEAIFVDEILLDAGFSTTGVSGNTYNDIIVSCRLIQKYKEDYLMTNTLNHRLEHVLDLAEKLGIKEKIIPLLERIMLG